ncbi:MAG: hypothetical protein JXR84_08410 [Anaerolineae bacterium]|nr:hypothetical protein [Anaerolineae bacterium]
MVLFSIILALFWGVLWAGFLQFNPAGRYLALRRTWLTVVIGVGVDLLILATVIPLEAWLPTCTVIAASSLGIIARSLYNEHQDEKAVEEFHASSGK